MSSKSEKLLEKRLPIMETIIIVVLPHLLTVDQV